MAWLTRTPWRVDRQQRRTIADAVKPPLMSPLPKASSLARGRRGSATETGQKKPLISLVGAGRFELPTPSPPGKKQRRSDARLRKQDQLKLIRPFPAWRECRRALEAGEVISARN